MSEITEQRLLDKGLEIANKLQNESLFGESNFEKNLYAFLTVSELLNRNDDIQWAKGEILGGFNDKIPSYRKISAKLWQKDNLLQCKNGDLFFQEECHGSYSQLKHMLEDKKKDTIDFMPSKKDIIKLQKNTNEVLTDAVTLIHVKSEVQGLLAGAKMEMLTRLNSIINEITYGKIPRGIFNKFQDKVNLKLSESNPKAISELNIAFESLGQSEDPERISHVAHSCKRLIKIIADDVCPPRDGDYEMKDGSSKKMGDEQYLNRLEVFVDSQNSKNRKFLLKKIKLLRDLYGETSESINRGTHGIISNQAAEMAVIYSYLILGEIIQERKS